MNSYQQKQETMTTFEIIILFFYYIVSTMATGKYFIEDAESKVIEVIFYILFGWLAFPFILGECIAKTFKSKIDKL